MLCDLCGKRPATVARSEIEEGRTVVRFRCEICAITPPAEKGSDSLKRPCQKCGAREGTVKLSRFAGGRRSVSYLCPECARL